MSIEQEIAGLTQSTTDLLDAVNTKKVTLDTAVSNAQTAVTDATSQVSLAAAEKVGAQDARDEAETHKNLAYTYSQSAASAVAYQDLTAIAESKAETARDVFVYDTRKDSDGGAWRKRTQGTSWYNETLNTSARGSRKEFPAVAVIVAEVDTVTIYDGDDPSLPIWKLLNCFGSTSTSVTALNGRILVGNDSGSNNTAAGGVWDFRFVEDIAFHWTITGSSNFGYNTGVSSLAQTVPMQVKYSGTGLVHSDVNDVAMTVLPNAPIDPDTGLPIPTIAVATNGGVSVIKDDGTVVDITTSTNYNYVTRCSFYGERLAFLFSFKNLAGDLHYHIVDIPSADIYVGFTAISQLNGEYYFKATTIPSLPATPLSSSNLENVKLTKNAIGSDHGFTPLDRLPENQEQGMVAYITSTYNTGWMNGDIKLATLSDTDDTDLVATELVTNGTFDSDVSGWSVPADSTSTIVHESSALRGARNSEGIADATLGAPLISGKTYTISFDLVETSNSSAYVYFLFGSQLAGQTPGMSTGSYSYTFVANGNHSTIRMRAGGAVFNFLIDNVSVRLAEPDRSVNNNGLQVFGTVTKEPVATGADLVAYRGFSGSNYLMQPYNSDLDFGTGELCIMGWIKTGDAYGVIIERRADGTSAGRFGVTTQPNAVDGLDFRLVSTVLSSTKAVATGQWVFFTCLRRNDTMELWLDGKLDSTQYAPDNIDGSGSLPSTRIGVRIDEAQTLAGDLALLRISGTAPTAEQVAKIYRDEKPLFQEGAQATLHGTSDAVTALAYDDSTDLLHVGTSVGRSVFKGLQRVDNTTDAVGTAISASNGLVVEE